MAYEHILVNAEDGVAILTLNRAEKLNAMNRRLDRHRAGTGGAQRGGSDGARLLRGEDPGVVGSQGDLTD